MNAKDNSMLFKIDSGKKPRAIQRLVTEEEEEKGFNPYAIRGKKHEDQSTRSGMISKASAEYMHLDESNAEQSASIISINAKQSR